MGARYWTKGQYWTKVQVSLPHRWYTLIVGPSVWLLVLYQQGISDEMFDHEARAGKETAS